MKQFLTILALLTATTMVGQTSEIELNYANGGYIELEKMGIDSKEGYTIEKTDLLFDEVFPRGDGPYSVLKLIRIEDKSIAAIMIAQDGVKPVFTVMDPKTKGRKQCVNNVGRMGTAIDVEDAFVKLLQKIYWTE
ncbi:hypothetical protein N8851_02910 [Schleiferiaceae bacterium]|nr:hypothetical protein [Schleiferiaceae bacterium]